MADRRRLLQTVLAGGGVTLYTISGTVYDADGTTAVASATVALGALSTTSAANGTYTISNVLAGTSGSMTCTKTGYTFTAISVSAMAGNLANQNYTNTIYSAVLRLAYGANEVWPLVDISSGTTITAKVASARNGTLSGWALQNGAGPVSGSLTISSDGTADYGDIYSSNGSTGLADIFNGSIGSMFAWGQISNSAVWTDGAYRNLVQLRVDLSNRITLLKNNSNNSLMWLYAAGGTNEIITATYSATTWFSMGISWNKTADEVKAFLNGSQTGATQTSLGTWAGTLAANRNYIGAESTVSTIWSGLIAYVAVKFGSVWSAANFLAMHNAAATSTPDP